MLTRRTVQMGWCPWGLEQRLYASQMFLSSLLTLPCVHLILKMDGDGVEMGNEIKSHFWLWSENVTYAHMENVKLQ